MLRPSNDCMSDMHLCRGGLWQTDARAQCVHLVDHTPTELDAPQHFAHELPDPALIQCVFMPSGPQVVAGFAKLMGERMDHVVGHTLTELDGRFQTVRNRESNLGNLVTDVWRRAAGAHIAILNSGSLRCVGGDAGGCGGCGGCDDCGGRCKACGCGSWLAPRQVTGAQLRLAEVRGVLGGWSWWLRRLWWPH